MLNIKEYLNKNIVDAFIKKEYDVTDAILSQSNRPDLSDYQSNVAMSIAKKYGKNPRQIAMELQADIEAIDGVYMVSVDGPGFINIKLNNEFLQNIENTKFEATSPATVVIDYGGPNIAKELHVGHLRPAIIGESVKRIMRENGDKVIGDVHFGDWGTPMGMLIAQLRIEDTDLEFFRDDFVSSNFTIEIDELSALYKRAVINFKESDVFKTQAREATALLQQGEPGYLALWKIFKEISVENVKKIYDELEVEFDLWLGESDVNDMLPPLFEDLTRRQIAIEDDGAIIVPLPDRGKKERAPLILRKSDGGYTYAATDLATIIQRVRDYNPDNILYVTDFRQREHFEQVFEVAKIAGFVTEKTTLEHLWYGTINGEDNRPFKTRDGGVMNLKSLINYAMDKAKENVPEASEEFSTEELEIQTKQIAIGALIFQDLKNNKTSDYIFDSENFTKSEGKNGAYIQYAIARINSILEKLDDKQGGEPVISHDLERELLLLLYRYPEALSEAYKRREPSVISEYIYVLAQKFSSFYSELSIKNEPDEKIRKSRIKLANLTKDTLKKGLDLLNIESPYKMIRK